MQLASDIDLVGRLRARLAGTAVRGDGVAEPAEIAPARTTRRRKGS
jgi:hypothetical protein